jgi:hypothetical protein
LRSFEPKKTERIVVRSCFSDAFIVANQELIAA